MGGRRGFPLIAKASDVDMDPSFISAELRCVPAFPDAHHHWSRSVWVLLNNNGLIVAGVILLLLGLVFAALFALVPDPGVSLAERAKWVLGGFAVTGAGALLGYTGLRQARRRCRDAVVVPARVRVLPEPAMGQRDMLVEFVASVRDVEHLAVCEVPRRLAENLRAGQEVWLIVVPAGATLWCMYDPALAANALHIAAARLRQTSSSAKAHQLSPPPTTQWARELRYQLNSADICEAEAIMELPAAERRTSGLVGCASFLVIAIGVILFVTLTNNPLAKPATSGGGRLALAATLLLTACGVACFLIGLKMTSRRARESSQSFQCEMDDEGIRLKSIHAVTRYYWSAFDRITQTPQLLVLVLHEGLKNRLILPKRAIGDESQIAACTAWMRGRIADARGTQ